MAKIAAEVILSLFAVFGAYAALRLLLTAIFAPTDMGAALLIGEETPEEAEARIRVARENYFLASGGHVYALIPQARANDEALLALFAQNDVKAFVYIPKGKE